MNVHVASAPIPDRWFRAAALVLALLGIAAFVGWSFNLTWLSEPMSGFPAFRPHFALGLVLASVATWALATGRASLAITVGIAVAALGLAATLGLVWDQWPLRAVEALSRETGRTVARGLILLFAGIAFVLTALAPKWPALWNMIGLLGVTVLALGTMMLAARIFGLVIEADDATSLLLGASPQMMIGAVVMGLAFSRAAWRDVGVTRIPPAWVAWAAGVGALLVVVLLWRALLLNEAGNVRRVVNAAGNAGAARLAGPIERAMVAVDQLARHTIDVGNPVWQSETEGRSLGGLTGLATISPTGEILMTNPTTMWDGFDRAVVERSLGRLRAAAWPDRSPRHAIVGREWFAVAVPIYGAEKLVGFAVGLVGLHAILPSEIADSTRFGYRLSLGDQRVAGDDPPDSRWLSRVDIYASTPTSRLEVWPQAVTVRSLRSNLPNVVFAFGLVVTILLPLAIQLARNSWEKARIIERGELYTALERGADGVWELDLADRTVRPSPSLWRHLGYSAGELPIPESRWAAAIHPDDVARYRAAIDGAPREEGFEVQYRFRARDDSWHWLVVRGRITERGPTGHPRRILGIIGDVTERRRADDERIASEQRYRATFESAFQFQALLAPDGSCLDVNRTALSFGGVKLDDVRTQPFWTTPWWREKTDSRDRLEAACLAAARGAIQRLEVEATGTNRQVAELDLSIKPLLAADGSVEQLLVEGRDLTGRKRAERLLREVEILATVGRVAAKVAHEINNPLAGIQNSFLLIKDAIPPTHPHIRYVGAIEREIGRISAVTRQLYETFGPERNGVDQPPDSLITETVALIRQLNRNADVRIVTDFRDPFPEGLVPTAIIRQAVYNLVQNSVDASPPGGEIRVATERVADGYQISVQDHGPGVPDVVRDRIFDPFYTTKPQSLSRGGMGLGLYLVRRSVEAVAGTIRLDSPPEGGTTFVIWFPSLSSSIAGVDS